MAAQDGEGNGAEDLIGPVAPSPHGFSFAALTSLRRRRDAPDIENKGPQRECSTMRCLPTR